MGEDGARGKDWLRARGHHLCLTDTIFYFFFFFLGGGGGGGEVVASGNIHNVQMFQMALLVFQEYKYAKLF